MLFIVLVFVFNFDLFKFSAAILEKGLLQVWELIIQKRQGKIFVILLNFDEHNKTQFFGKVFKKSGKKVFRDEPCVQMFFKLVLCQKLRLIMLIKI